MNQPYEIYVKTFGRVKSGVKLERGDYGETDAKADWHEYDEKGKLAVTLGADDAKDGSLKFKAEFEQEIKKILGL